MFPEHSSLTLSATSRPLLKNRIPQRFSPTRLLRNDTKTAKMLFSSSSIR